MMIGPEQGKKASGKPGKKKNKAKKAKRLAAEIELLAPAAHDVERTAGDADPTTPVAAAPEPPERVAPSGLAAAPDPQLASQPKTENPSDAVPEVGPQLLAWIDRVQERVDHLLTLVDPSSDCSASDSDAVASPAATDNDPAAEAEAAAEPAERIAAVGPAEDPDPEPELGTTEPGGTDEASAVGDDPASADAEASSLAEAWARRQETAEGVVLDDEPFESADARLTAVLVARELLARGESPSDVRRRLREGYGVADPDAVLAQTAA